MKKAKKKRSGNAKIAGRRMKPATKTRKGRWFKISGQKRIKALKISSSGQVVAAKVATKRANQPKKAPKKKAKKTKAKSRATNKKKKLKPGSRA